MLPKAAQLFVKLGPEKLRIPSGTAAVAPVLLVTVSTPLAAAEGPHVPVVSTEPAGAAYFCKMARLVAEIPGRAAKALYPAAVGEQTGDPSTEACPIGLYSKAPKKNSLFLTIGPPNEAPMRLLS